MSGHGLKAYYGLRNGGSGGCSVLNLTKLEGLMRGKYGVTTVRVETNTGEFVGSRERIDGKWFWSYDQEIAREALAKAQS